MKVRNSAFSLALIGLMLIMPMASIPVRAQPSGPSMWLQAGRYVGGSGDSYSYEIWTIAAYDAGPTPYFALQAHMSYYSITYEYVTFTDFYEGDTYMYTDAVGTAIMWGTLGLSGGIDDGGVPDVQAAPALTSWSSQASAGSSGLPLHANHALGSLPLAPLPFQVGYGEEDGFYWTEPNIGGRGILLVKPDGRFNYETPELAFAFAFTGSSPSTQSKVIAAGSFTGNEGTSYYEGSAYVVGANVKLTGMVYSFEYTFDYNGNIYGSSLVPTGQTATHTLVLAGRNGYASGWYVDGNGSPNEGLENVYDLAVWGTPWFPAAYWWFD